MIVQVTGLTAEFDSTFAQLAKLKQSATVTESALQSAQTNANSTAAALELARNSEKDLHAKVHQLTTQNSHLEADLRQKLADQEHRHQQREASRKHEGSMTNTPPMAAAERSTHSSRPM